MNVTFANGTARQRQWVNDAIAACQYPLQVLNANVTVQFTTLTACQNLHTYMCTDHHGSADFTIQIEPWADDPTNVNNLGLADPNRDLHEFFIDSFVHEIGHVWQFLLPGNLADICSNFVHIPDGRRGTAADYNGTEITQNQWSELIKEALSEWFRLVYLPERQVYGNRTKWSLFPADLKRLYSTVISSSAFEYETPIECQVVLTVSEAGWVTFTPFDNCPTSFAWDYTAGESAFGGGVQALMPGPQLFNTGETMLLSYNKNGSMDEDEALYKPFDDTLDGGLGGPCGPGILHDPAQRAFNEAPTLLGLPVLPSEPVSLPGFPIIGVRTGWQVTREIQVEIDLPPHSDWGILELHQIGQAVIMVGLHGGYGETRASFDSNGNPVNPADGFSPWGSQARSGNGPFFDSPQPPLLSPGWAGVCQLIKSVSFQKPVGNASGSGFMGLSGFQYEPPAASVPQPPSSPCPSSTTGSTTTPSGTTTTTQDHVWSQADVDSFQGLPVTDNEGGLAMADISPRQAKYVVTYTFLGYSELVDTVTGIGIRARFFPVKPVTPTPPVPHPPDPGKTFSGPAQGGSVRSKKDIALARRELQAVERVGGGTPR